MECSTDKEKNIKGGNSGKIKYYLVVIMILVVVNICTFISACLVGNGYSGIFQNSGEILTLILATLLYTVITFVVDYFRMVKKSVGKGERVSREVLSNIKVPVFYMGLTILLLILIEGYIIILGFISF